MTRTYHGMSCMILKEWLRYLGPESACLKISMGVNLFVGSVPLSHSVQNVDSKIGYWNDAEIRNTKVDIPI